MRLDENQVTFISVSGLDQDSFEVRNAISTYLTLKHTFLIDKDSQYDKKRRYKVMYLLLKQTQV